MILFNCSHIFTPQTLYVVKQIHLINNMLCFSVSYVIIIFD
nr:MAG TPA: hypothetical protein [Caudoviricetes sp.]